MKDGDRLLTGCSVHLSDPVLHLKLGVSLGRRKHAWGIVEAPGCLSAMPSRPSAFIAFGLEESTCITEYSVRWPGIGDLVFPFPCSREFLTEKRTLLSYGLQPRVLFIQREDEYRDTEGG